MPVHSLPNALSMDFILEKIFSRLGASHRRVEIEDLDLAKLIAHEVLPQYSKYFPYEHQELLTSHNHVPGRQGRYYISTQLPVINANRMISGMDTRAGVGAMTYKGEYRDGDVVIGGGNVVGGLLSAMEMNTVLATTSLPVTIRFNPPNEIEIYPKEWYDGQAVLLNCVHPVTLHTIGFNMLDEFFDLCWAETRIAMLAIFKKFQTINTVYGEIQFSLDDLEKGEDDKKETIEKWKPKSLLRSGNKRWYVV